MSIWDTLRPKRDPNLGYTDKPRPKKKKTKRQQARGPDGRFIKIKNKN